MRHVVPDAEFSPYGNRVRAWMTQFRVASVMPADALPSASLRLMQRANLLERLQWRTRCRESNSGSCHNLYGIKKCSFFEQTFYVPCRNREMNVKNVKFPEFSSQIPDSPDSRPYFTALSTARCSGARHKPKSRCCSCSWICSARRFTWRIWRSRSKLGSASSACGSAPCASR
jgi:hypothetical protein